MFKYLNHVRLLQTFKIYSLKVAFKPRIVCCYMIVYLYWSMSDTFDSKRVIRGCFLLIKT